MSFTRYLKAFLNCKFLFTIILHRFSIETVEIAVLFSIKTVECPLSIFHDMQFVLKGFKDPLLVLYSQS